MFLVDFILLIVKLSIKLRKNKRMILKAIKQKQKQNYVTNRS